MSRKLSTYDIRQMFLDFFESKQHLIVSSHSTISPDPTTMFTIAGMQPFKTYFTGSDPLFNGKRNKRVTSVQKCVRIDDIENVGRTRRHLSLFEMMGNFSFGDYFQKDTIYWAWEFLTSKQWLGLEKDKIYVTVYKEDQEAFQYWHHDIGLPIDHIHRFDADENFWPADAPLKGPNGPCGPCSEIFYDRGPKYGNDTWEDYAKTRESARFLEVWNLVFPQFERQDLDDNGNPILKDLPFKNIDTGMGLERVASIVQDVPDFYSNDVFLPIIREIEKLSGQTYKGEQSFSHRVIAEHIRSVSIIIADGTYPDKNKANYVVRKVLRRAIRHMYKLGLHKPVLHTLVPLVVEKMGEAYPELVSEKSRIQDVILREEENFLRTLSDGIKRLNKILESLKSGDVLSGQDAFTLYDTYGFPLELTQEIAQEHSITVDIASYEKAMEQAQELARPKEKISLFTENNTLIDGIPETKFVGYDQLKHDGKILAIIQDNELVDQLSQKEAVIILSETPFYAESGGEVGDTGHLKWDGGLAKVTDTQKTMSGVFLHSIEMIEGELQKDLTVQGVVAPERRATERHHTATHLLHAALRAVLGDGVAQKGSLVAPDRLRFDFSHAKALTAEEITEIELLMSRWISENCGIRCLEMPIAEAKAAGATALFGEKYGEIVRVVQVIGDVQYHEKTVNSIELCGGAHVNSTGDIGAFVLLSDENISAGVRRIEALAGEAATQWLRTQLQNVSKVANLLNTSPENLESRVTGLQTQLKTTDKELGKVKRQLTEAQMSNNDATQISEFGGFKIAHLQLAGIESHELRNAAQKLLESNQVDLAVVASDKNLVIKASKDAVARGAHAGQLIGTLAKAGGGKGGGRPDMAQAGINNPKEALEALPTAFN